MLSSNIYDFCCLQVNQISSNEIAKYFLYKNNSYYKKLSDEDRKNFIPSSNYKLNVIKILTEKYIEILKNNK